MQGGLPLYRARRVCPAALSRLVVRLAEPPATADVPSGAAPSQKVTLPPPGAGDICAVKVTGRPNRAGFGATDNVVEVGTGGGAMVMPQLLVAVPPGVPVESATRQ